MKIVSVILGMFLSFGAFAESSTEPVEPKFFSSCLFEGQFASGCIEYFGASWTDESALNYCQEQSKKGKTIELKAEACPRNNYDSLCSNSADKEAIVDIYVNRMPSYICKKYMSGELSKKPADGWPQ